MAASSSSVPGAACRALFLYNVLWRSLLLLRTQLDCLVKVSNTFKMLLPRSKAGKTELVCPWLG